MFKINENADVRKQQCSISNLKKDVQQNHWTVF